MHIPKTLYLFDSLLGPWYFKPCISRSHWNWPKTTHWKFFIENCVNNVLESTHKQLTKSCILNVEVYHQQTSMEKMQPQIGIEFIYFIGKKKVAGRKSRED